MSDPQDPAPIPPDWLAAMTLGMAAPGKDRAGANRGKRRKARDRRRRRRLHRRKLGGR